MDRSVTSLVSASEPHKERRTSATAKWLKVGLALLLAASLLTAAVALPVWYASLGATPPPTPRASLPAAGVSWPSPGPVPMGSYKHFAVSSDSETCSEIGKEILSNYGSAVDAAIATMLCIGVVHPQSTGIGGGSFMTVYNRVRNESVVYDFREVAPRASNETMYAGNESLSVVGGMAVAVPGEIAGYRLAWERHGRLPWAELFRRTIELCESGVRVNRMMAEALVYHRDVLRQSAPFRAEFFKANGDPASEGETIFRQRLGRTLRAIADDPYSFYNGSLATDIVHDIQEYGGIIDGEDLREYEVKVRQPVVTDLPNAGVRLLLAPPPASGPVLGLILGILDGYDLKPRDFSDAAGDVASTTLSLHRIIEAFKFGYAMRTKLGDPDFINVTQIVADLTSPEFASELRRKITDNATHDTSYYGPSFYNRTGGGTSHLSIIDGLGNAVAMTSTINFGFGAKIMGSRTGIIFNNEMEDFSAPYQPNSLGSNFIRPRKRPLSSMCPAVAVSSGGGHGGDTGEARLAFGAAGGTRIITASATVAINHLYFGMTPKAAIDLPRMHHQLEPSKIRAESGFPEAYRRGLEKKGHVFYEDEDPVNSVANAVARSSDGRQLRAYADQRKDGGTAGL